MAGCLWLLVARKIATSYCIVIGIVITLCMIRCVDCCIAYSTGMLRWPETWLYSTKCAGNVKGFENTHSRCFFIRKAEFRDFFRFSSKTNLFGAYYSSCIMLCLTVLSLSMLPLQFNCWFRMSLKLCVNFTNITAIELEWMHVIMEEEHVVMTVQ